MSDDHTADRILQVSLSKNGSRTYGDPRYCDLPETGDFKKRIRLTRFGQMRTGVLEIASTSPVDITLIAVSIEVG